MNLSERASDALIGAFVAGALLVLVTAIYFTTGWNRRTWHVYITAASAEGLNSDTKVYLHTGPPRYRAGRPLWRG